MDLKQFVLNSNLKAECETCDFSLFFNGGGYICTNNSCIYFNPRCNDEYIKTPIQDCDCWKPKKAVAIKIMQEYIRDLILGNKKINNPINTYKSVFFKMFPNARTGEIGYPRCYVIDIFGGSLRPKLNFEEAWDEEWQEPRP